MKITVGRLLSFKTKISKANTNSSSLRTTIPIEIVRIFNLKENDYIEWVIELNGESINVFIRPIRGGINNENAP